MKKRNLIERMEAEGVLCAEGFLFEMERRGYLASGEFVPEVALECPDALKNLHKHAGSDIVEAFNRKKWKLKKNILCPETVFISS